MAADTRNVVQEIKKLATLARPRNLQAAQVSIIQLFTLPFFFFTSFFQTLEESAAELVLAVKGILAARKTNSVPAAHAALEGTVEAVKAKAGMAVM